MPPRLRQTPRQNRPPPRRPAPQTCKTLTAAFLPKPRGWKTWPAAPAPRKQRPRARPGRGGRKIRIIRNRQSAKSKTTRTPSFWQGCGFCCAGLQKAGGRSRPPGGLGGCSFVKEFFEQMVGNKFDNYHSDNKVRAPSKNIGDLEADACRGFKAATFGQSVCAVDGNVPPGCLIHKFQGTGALLGHRNRRRNAVTIEEGGSFYRQKASASVRLADNPERIPPIGPVCPFILRIKLPRIAGGIGTVRDGVVDEIEIRQNQDNGVQEGIRAILRLDGEGGTQDG